MNSSAITVSALVDAPVEKTWEYWTKPQHIVNWTFASDDWHCPKATNDATTGGTFSSTMAVKDGSMSFDFEGVYDNVTDYEKIEYTLADGRKVAIHFEEQDGKTLVTEIFEPENMNPIEMQREGWQAIMDNFKKYTQEN